MGTTSIESDLAFQEICLVGITKMNGSGDYQFASSIEYDSLDFGAEEKGGESIALGNGGRIWKRTPEGDFEIKFKLYPLSLDVTDLQDMAQFFLGGTYDSSAPVSQVNTRGRDLFRVICLWTDDASATKAGSATTAGASARRITVKYCRVTEYKESFSDGILSAEVTFKAPAFNRSGTGSITRESVLWNDAAGLPTISGFTS
jgi:hypothetical protein